MKPNSVNSFWRIVISSLFIVALMFAALGQGAIIPARAAAGGPPQNDDIAYAIDISSNLSTYPYTYSASEGTIAATVAASDPFIPQCNENFGAASVWFQFTAPENGLLTINTYGSNYDTLITLWSGAPGNLTWVACNDDAPTTTDTVRSKATAWVTKDKTYYIEVVQNYGDFKSNPTSSDLQRLINAIGGGSLSLNVTLSKVQALGSATYDDKNGSLIYSGNWVNYSGAGPYGNTLFYSDDMGNGNSVSFVFNGNQFYLMYTQFTNRGVFKVYIDNDPAKTTTINQNGPLGWQKVWPSQVLPTGIHYVTLVHDSGAVVDIDTIITGSATEYPVNPPNTVTDLAASTGTASGTINLTFTAPGDDSLVTAQVPVAPSGTATNYQFRYSTSGPITTANWAAATQYTGSVITPTPVNTLQNATLVGFTPGTTYYFAMVAVDDRGFASGVSNSTSAMAQTVQALGPGIYDDSNSAWKYVGSWMPYSGAGPYANTLRYSGLQGNSAEIQIIGQQFILTYTGYSNRGAVEVYLDADTTPLDTFTQYDTALVWQKTYQSPGFSAGTHLVRLVNKTPGAYIDIDAITVLATPDGTAPAAIVNLSTLITNATPIGGITLNWAAPGGDGWFGRAASYEVRYSFSPITDQVSWDNATLVTTGVPTPAAAGTTQTMAITGLFPSTSYYFAVRAKDASGNLGSISNTPFAKPKSPTPVGAGLYDDASTAWIYNGSGWQSVSAAGPYSNTLRYSGVLNDSAQFTFTGPQFTLYYSVFTNRGTYDVYVDGMKIDSFNANGALLYQQQYTSPLLDIGVHTVRFVNATPNAYIDIDAIRIASAASAGIVDDTDGAWKYGGSGWQAITNVTGPYNKTLRYSGTLNDYAEIIFAGPQFTLYYSTYDNRGEYDVYVDGSKVDTFSANGSLAWQQQYTSPLLSNGLHVVRFVNVTPGAFIDIDAIKIAKVVGAGKTDDTDAAWLYGGSGWQSVANVTGPYNKTLRYSGTLNDYAEIIFAGSQFTLYYTTYTNRGYYDVYIDENKVGSFNADGALAWQQQYISPPLSNGLHVARFVNVTPGKFIDIDAIEVQPTPLLPGTYDDTYGSLVYTGNWLPFTGVGPYDNTLRYAGDLNAAVSFKFEGSQFRLLYTGYTNRGSFDVYVDGQLMPELNEFNSPLVWQMTYASPVFSPGLHEAMLIHRAGAYVDVDAVTIMP